MKLPWPSAYVRNLYREILRSPIRFASILLLLMIGAGLFYGQSITPASMEYTSDQYYDETALFDVWLHSDEGLPDSAAADLSALPGARSVQMEISMDMLGQWENEAAVLRAHSIPEGGFALNKPKLIEGRMPQSPGECLADWAMFSSGRMRLGDTINVEGDGLAVSSLTVVGAVTAPQYTLYTRGTSLLGNGRVEAFVLLPEECLAAPRYTDAYVGIEGAREAMSDSPAYLDLVGSYLSEVESMLASGRSPALAELALAGDLTVGDRSLVKGYRNYLSDIRTSNRIYELIPIFVFGVALIVCSATMMRAVHARRPDTAVLYALGAHGLRVTFPFYFFAGMAGLLGSLLGCFAGHWFIPRLLAGALARKFPGMPPVISRFSAPYAVASIAISVVCGMLASAIALRNERRAIKRASAGHSARIALERAGWLWKRLGFMAQITLRNIFRHKGRTIISLLCAIACAYLSLCVISFNLTLQETVDVQYDILQSYDISITLRSGVDEALAKESALAILEDIPSYGRGEPGLGEPYADVTQRAAEIQHQDASILCELVIPSSLPVFPHFFTLRDPERYRPLGTQPDFVAISQNAAEMLGIEPGDSILVNWGEGPVELTVTDLCESHLIWRLFVSPDALAKAGIPLPPADTLLVKAPGITEYEVGVLTTRLLEANAAIAVHDVAREKREFMEVFGPIQHTFNVITWITFFFIFIILSNLTVWAKLERSRELASLSQIGYTAPRVEAYLYRESALIAAIGILLAYILAVFTAGPYIKSLNGEINHFVNRLYPAAFVFSGIATFAVITLAPWLNYLLRRILPGRSRPATRISNT